MSNPIYPAPQTMQPAVTGVQVQYPDWNALGSFVLACIGEAIAFSQNSPNGIPNWQALAVTPAGGMVVSIGGASVSSPQVALVNGVMSYSSAATSFTVPPNGGSGTRTDLIAVQSLMQQGSTVTREVEQTDGSKPLESVPYNFPGMQFQYVTGSVTPPAGYQAFAEIAVPVGALTISSGEITVLFPVFNPTGATGPAGPPGTNGSNGLGLGRTTQAIPTSSIVPLGAVTVYMTDFSAFVAGSRGVALGPLDGNIFAFQAQSIDAAGGYMSVAIENVYAQAGTNMLAGAVVFPTGPAWYQYLDGAEYENYAGTVGANGTQVVLAGDVSSNGKAMSVFRVGGTTGTLAAGASFSSSSVSGYGIPAAYGPNDWKLLTTLVGDSSKVTLTIAKSGRSFTITNNAASTASCSVDWEIVWAAP